MLEWLVLTEGQPEAGVSLTGEHLCLSDWLTAGHCTAVFSPGRPGLDWALGSPHSVWSEWAGARERERDSTCVGQRWPDWWRHSARDNWAAALLQISPTTLYKLLQTSRVGFSFPATMDKLSKFLSTITYFSFEKWRRFDGRHETVQPGRKE